MVLEKCPEKDKLFLEDVKTLTFAKVECIRQQYKKKVAVKAEPVFRTQRGNINQQKKSSFTNQHQYNKKSTVNTFPEKILACTICGYKNHLAENCKVKSYTCKKCHQ